MLENIYLNYSKKIEYCQVTGTGIGDGKRNRKVPLVPEDDSTVSAKINRTFVQTAPVT